MERVDARAVVSTHRVGPVAKELGPVGYMRIVCGAVVLSRRIKCRGARENRNTCINVYRSYRSRAAYAVAHVSLVIRSVPAHSQREQGMLSLPVIGSVRGPDHEGIELC